MLLPAGAFVNLTPLMVKSYSLAFLFVCTTINQINDRMVADPNDHFWEVKKREMPAAMKDPALGTHGFFQTKNVKLHYVEKGDRTKPLMLLVHGYPDFWYSWRHQIKEFSSDYWVVAMDMRGFGESEKPEGVENYGADTLAADIRDLVDGLGKKTVTLVGHDWGGIITWYFALTYPKYIDSYVIMNTGHPYVIMKALQNDPAQITRSWYMFFYQFPYLPELRATMDDMAFLTTTFASSKSPSPITAEDLECYKYNYGQPGAFTTAINIYRANLMFKTSHKLVGKGDSPKFPQGLIIFGTGDKITDLVQEESTKMAANIKYVTIPEANHFVHQDDPKAVNTEMRTFFSDVKKKKTS